MEEIHVLYNTRSSFIIIIAMLMAGFTGIRYAYANIFRNTYQPVALFSFKPMAEQGAGIKLLSTENILITLLLSGSLSFSTLIFGRHFGFTDDIIPNSFVGILFAWLLLLGAIGLLFLLKFIFLALAGWLFDYPLAQSAHYQEYQSMSHVFNFFFALTLGLGLIGMSQLSDPFMEAMAYVYLGFFILRQVILLLRLYVKGGYTIYYIFSYLCTTELIPWIICIGILRSR